MNEEFDKWYETNPFESWGTHTVADIQAAYLAGVAMGYAKGVTTMREKCAEMTEKFTFGRYRENEYEFDLMTERIATAIREIEVG